MVIDARKIDHSDQPESTDGHHAKHHTDDQISAEKTKVSGRLSRLDTERATIAARLTDLETAERVLTRVSKIPPTRRTKLAAAEAKATTASRGRGRPPKAAAGKSAGSKPGAPTLVERVLDLAWAKLRTLVEGARLASTSLWP